jgi:ABC-type amino acid transport substrate-binding protein
MSAMLGSAAGAFGQDPPLLPIRMAFNGNFQPFFYREKGGVFTGILVEIFDRLGPGAGLHFEYEDLPWARAQQMVRAGHLDGLCTMSTAERRSYIEFAPTPVVEEPTVIVYRAGDTRVETVEVPGGLGRLRFGVPLGNGWAKEILPDAQIEWAADIDNLLDMIAMGRIDASLLGLWTVQAHLARDSKLAYRVLSIPSRDSAFRFGLRKSFPHCQEIVAKVDQALQGMRGAGAIDEIVRRYVT